MGGESLNNMAKSRTFISIETTKEIREALKQKASMEGKTVTDVISQMINEYLSTSIGEAEVSNVVDLQQKLLEMQQVIEQHAQQLRQHQQCLGELSA
jgi:regulator of PEP synthase PpsR (kinase-PPPase family)